MIKATTVIMLKSGLVLCKCMFTRVIKIGKSDLMFDSVINKHCVRSILIRSFSGPYFPEFELNTDQINSE